MREIYFFCRIITMKKLTLLDRLWFTLNLQKERIKERGLINNLIGWGTLITIFVFIPPLVKSIWPTHIENPFFFYLKSTFAISLLTILYLLIYLPGYMKWTNAYEKYRIQPQLSKPWERPDWPQVRKRWAKFWFLNKCVVNPLYLIVLSNFSTVSYRCDLESFPTTIELVKTFVCVMVVDDFLYWLIHNIFHEVKFLYKFHKIHHEYDSCFSMIGEYTHPIEQVFANFLPATFAFTMINSHVFAILFWLAYKLYMSSQGHSGYEFPWSFTRVMPFVYSPRYHDFHHTKNVGNYATSLYLTETLFGTNEAFFNEEYKKGRIQTELKKIKAQ